MRALSFALLALAVIVPAAIAADRNGGPGVDRLIGMGSSDDMTVLDGNDRLQGLGGTTASTAGPATTGCS